MRGGQHERDDARRGHVRWRGRRHPGLLQADAEATSAPARPFDPSAGDDWGSVFAVSGLLIGLVVIVLLLGGS